MTFNNYCECHQRLDVNLEDVAERFEETLSGRVHARMKRAN